MQLEERLAHHEETDSSIQLLNAYQRESFLPPSDFHRLRGFHGGVVHQVQQAFHQQGEYSPIVSLLNHSNLALFQAHKVSLFCYLLLYSPSYMTPLMVC
jgi:hypothetical protein